MPLIEKLIVLQILVFYLEEMIIQMNATNKSHYILL